LTLAKVQLTVKSIISFAFEFAIDKITRNMTKFIYGNAIRVDEPKKDNSWHSGQK